MDTKINWNIKMKRQELWERVFTFQDCFQYLNRFEYISCSILFFSYIFLGLFVYMYLCRPSEASTWYCVIPGGHPPQDWQSLSCAGEELDSNPGLRICSQVRYHWATSPPIHWATSPPAAFMSSPKGNIKFLIGTECVYLIPQRPQ